MGVVKRLLQTSKVQVLFFIAILATLTFLVSFTQKCAKYIERMKINQPDDYNFPCMADLLVSLAFSAFFLIAHIIWLKFVPNMMEQFVKPCKD